jgi:glucokinase
MLRQRATILADVILDLALILNPNLILLGGEVGNHPALLRELNSLLEGGEFAVLRVELGCQYELVSVTDEPWHEHGLS